jgi:hypothetical protein
MQTIQVTTRDGFASTERVDYWWLAPLFTAIGLVVFFGYLTFRAFNGTYVWYPPYISPAVAPPVLTPAAGYPGSVPVEHAWFGAFPSWWPWFIPTTPAIFLPGLAILFRFTCYYYRGAYYKAFAQRPSTCGVRSRTWPRYRGERNLLTIQNLHRYTFYGAVLLLVFLWEEGLSAFFKDGRFGIGVGTVVMLINASLLSGYTFGCHSWRHLIGGRLDCFSCDAKPSSRYGLWKGSTWLNERHMLFAWCSLVWVCFTDFYVYLVSSGRIHDLNTW